MSDIPYLSAAQLERLAFLAEELGEAMKAIGKILRHGYESHNPDDPAHSGNRRDLEKELGDVFHAVELLTEAGDLLAHRIAIAHAAKRASVRQYMHHQDRGTQ